MDRHRVYTRLAHMLGVLLCASVACAEPPTLTWFYGKHLTFRSIGIPQRCANILGNVQDPDGISALTCSINGGAAKVLSIGADTRRLLNAGDFNIDISWPEILPLPDSNIVVVTATDSQSEVAEDTVIVRYHAGTQWPFPASVTWSEYSDVMSAAQVVDGEWSLQGSAVRNIDVGYDRLLAIGDTTWTDYEVAVPITIHSIDPGGYNPVSGQPAVGIFVRWIGHTDDPFPGWQPLSGYYPSGALGMYVFNAPENGGERLEIWQHAFDESGGKLSLGVTYIFKMRVESLGEGDHYALRVWREGTPEPSVWDLVYLDETRRASHGSALLVSHHVDATFGNVEIGVPSLLPVQLAEFAGVSLTESRVRLYWRTLGETANYGFEVERAAREPVAFNVIPGSFTPGHGTTIEPHEYTYIDSGAVPGIWYYRLKQIDLDGSIVHHEPIRVLVSGSTSAASTEISSRFELRQNYPNPFNPITTIGFRVQGSGLRSTESSSLTPHPTTPHVHLAVYDMLGREVAVLVNEEKAPGNYKVTFDGSILSSGVYYYRLEIRGLRSDEDHGYHEVVFA